MEGPQNGLSAHEHPEICQLVHRGYADKVYPMQQLMRNKEKEFDKNERAQEVFENL